MTDSVCRECGTALSEGAKFCPNCGAPLIRSTAGGTPGSVAQSALPARETPSGLGRTAAPAKESAGVLGWSLMIMAALAAVTLAIAVTLAMLPFTQWVLVEKHAYGFRTSLTPALVYVAFCAVSCLVANSTAARRKGRLLVVGCGLLVLGSVIPIFSDGLAGATVSRALYGVAVGVIIVAFYPVLAGGLSGGQIRQATILMGIGVGLGTLVVFLGIGRMPDREAFVRNASIVVAVLALAAGIVVATQREFKGSSRQAREGVTRSEWLDSLRSSARDRRTIVLALCTLAVVAIFAGTIVGLANIELYNMYGWLLATALFFFGLIGVGQVVGSFLGAALVKRETRLLPLVISLIVLLIAGVLTGIVLFVGHPAVVGLLTFVTGTAGMICLWVLVSHLRQTVVEPRRFGIAIGFNSAVGFAGALVALLVLMAIWGEKPSESAFTVGFAVLGVFALPALIGLAFFQERAQAIAPEHVQSATGHATMPSVKSHMAWAIISLVFFFLPTAVVAIVYASTVNTLTATGDVTRALEASRKAKIWCWISTIIAVVGWIFLLILWLVLISRAGIWRHAT